MLSEGPSPAGVVEAELGDVATDDGSFGAGTELCVMESAGPVEVSEAGDVGLGSSSFPDSKREVRSDHIVSMLYDALVD